MVKITKDGRTIRTHKSYTEFRRDLHKTQGGRCANPECEQSDGRMTFLYAPLELDCAFHVNHLNGRGAGKRDDVVTRDGREVCRGDCGKCHRIFHGQQSAVESQPQWSVKNV
jgi:hypothetical protein